MSGWAWIEQFFDPGQTSVGGGYWFWSGLGSGTPLLIPLGLWWRHHNCHVEGCWRINWHPHPDNGHLVCKKHHPYTLKPKGTF